MKELALQNAFRKPAASSPNGKLLQHMVPQARLPSSPSLSPNARYLQGPQVAGNARRTDGPQEQSLGCHQLVTMPAGKSEVGPGPDQPGSALPADHSMTSWQPGGSLAASLAMPDGTRWDASWVGQHPHPTIPTQPVTLMSSSIAFPNASAGIWAYNGVPGSGPAPGWPSPPPFGAPSPATPPSSGPTPAGGPLQGATDSAPQPIPDPGSSNGFGALAGTVPQLVEAVPRGVPQQALPQPPSRGSPPRGPKGGLSEDRDGSPGQQSSRGLAPGPEDPSLSGQGVGAGRVSPRDTAAAGGEMRVEGVGLRSAGAAGGDVGGKNMGLPKPQGSPPPTRAAAAGSSRRFKGVDSPKPRGVALLQQSVGAEAEPEGDRLTPSGRRAPRVSSFYRCHFQFFVPLSM